MVILITWMYLIIKFYVVGDCRSNEEKVTSFYVLLSKDLEEQLVHTAFDTLLQQSWQVV
jgi:hypothetical protein